MAATQKAQLEALTAKEFERLYMLLQPIDANAAMEKDVDHTSIKDVVGHRAHWIELFLGWYADGMAGKEVAFPAPGYKWNELKRYNTDLGKRQADLDWPAALAMLRDQHLRLVDWMSDRSQEELYGGPMKGAKNDWTPGRWAEAAGPSHYRSASKYVRSRLKARE
ncbi:ClbS/DfsB family four-helix bundle protein [Chelativorans sp. ZYF759]|uniref:ClbS/DfsB family four-helix bundle protein n=1 Tax=Chelativorans sp. ZYF759 TaxID=2692213 RepID=UPI00145C9C71|nr:ClbS/DfsB family four-helix bundle protein [Chelativorans sp. ZYF759]NMG37958.1 ClbS/DfsB family four-helix bundle protein [Chelativorans sp. ZYF759]